MSWESTYVLLMFDVVFNTTSMLCVELIYAVMMDEVMECYLLNKKALTCICLICKTIFMLCTKCCVNFNSMIFSFKANP